MASGSEKEPIVELVTRIKTPIRLDYTVMAGRELSRFLLGIAQRRILGRRCPRCQKVYVPPRGACVTCAVMTDEEVEVSQTGTVTTFCVINIPFEGQMLTPPYVCASVLLDGADLPLFHLIGGNPDDVRMGLRVRAVWVDQPGPTLESIRYFEATGEPDAPFESYEGHL
jgi:uncharacterized OB-fold protein